MILIHIHHITIPIGMGVGIHSHRYWVRKTRISGYARDGYTYTLFPPVHSHPI